MVDENAIATYAAWNNELTERMLSSSGGMFSAFAAEVFGKAGVVYAVEEKAEGLCYQRAVKLEDIRTMQGSKYYQAKSYTIDLKSLYSDVELNKCVLLLGTSCQIGMFKALLNERYKKIPENILLVDIICHGVASRKEVEAYRKELEKKNGRLLRHTFRNKKNKRRGSQYSEYTFESGRIFQTDNENDYFMRFFSPGFFLRPSCYECKYAGKNKESDISIGDFNGASRVVKNFPDDTHCVSAVIVNTEKGKKFIEQVILDNRITVISTEYDIIASQNLPLLHSTERPRVRDFAINWIDKFGFINTCRLLGGKYYLRNVVKKIGGENFLNLIKRILGRTVIEH